MTRIAVDIDTRRHQSARLRTLRLLHGLAREMGGRWTIEERRSTRGGIHFLVTSSLAFSPVEIVAVQLLLGSDLARERWNFARSYKLPQVPEFWRGRWNVLYSAKAPKGARGSKWRSAE